jgi:hypothetical protein
MLAYEQWKALLRKDCIACDKLEAFDGIGDVILRILYNNGLDPTVAAIVKNGLNTPGEPAPHP